MLRSIALLVFVTFGSSIQSCPQIDPTKKDFDGMPFCPDLVKTSSAYVVYSCAIEQAKSFHVPTKAEDDAILALLNTFKAASLAGKPSIETTGGMLSQADKLGLQACRVAQTLDGQPDSYLLFYTKPGVHDYSGPFLLARETKASKIALIGPHDDSDGTYADTKLGVQNSHALILFSNGHKRGAVRSPSLPHGGDFVHETNNLGTHAVKFFGDLFPGYVWLHIHGMADDKKVLDRSRNAQLQAIFEDAIKKYTNINAFDRLNADFSVDSLVHTDWYLKTEMPAKIHENNHQIIANIVKYMEQYPWAWAK